MKAIPGVQRSASSVSSEGSVVLESVVLVPVAMMIILLAVQVCLWAHAATLVQSAATAGEQAATSLGGSPTAGRVAAQAELSLTAKSLVANPLIRSSDLAGDVVEIKVTGTTESIIPWLHLPVSATRDGIRQEFRQSG